MSNLRLLKYLWFLPGQTPPLIETEAFEWKLSQKCLFWFDNKGVILDYVIPFLDVAQIVDE